MSRRLARLVALVVASAAVTLAGVSSAAAANEPTSIAFVGESDVTAAFTSSWELAVQVSSNSEYSNYIVSESDGTVDFQVAGLPGAFVSGATIYPGGVAYFTQPADQPPLAAGTYTVTAIFSPAANSSRVTSKTSKPATLTITPLALSLGVELLTDPAEAAAPTVRTSITGEYVDVVGTPPSGTWTVTGEDSRGDNVFVVTAEQPTQASEGVVRPLDIPLADSVKPGETYTITTEFEADPLLAPGLEFSAVEPVSYTTKPLTLGESLTAPVAVPIWVTILNGLLLIGLVMVLGWVIGAWSRRRTESRSRERSEPGSPITARAVGAINAAPAESPKQG